MNYYKLLELITDLNEAREDRKVLAKQLRDERLLSSQLITALVLCNEELARHKEAMQIVLGIDEYEFECGNGLH